METVSLYDAATPVANVDPAYRYERPLPHLVIGDEAAREHLLDAYRTWNAEHRSASPSDLFQLENALLYDRTLYLPAGREWIKILETDRPFERAFKVETLTDERLQNVMRARDSTTTSYLYLGTVGSENYAHWLVDDLTRARAALAMSGPVVFVLDRYFEAIDRVREESLYALFGSREVGVLFIEKKAPFFFETLYYVTPNTSHPFLKSPSALAALRQRFAQPHPDAPRRLFVGRKALWRNLLNESEVQNRLQALGFTTLTIDRMSFAEQIRWFSNADLIVGVAGASMGNTIFSPSGASLVYLAGEGFIDPFYWDMAAVAGQRYGVVLGTPWRPDKPTFSSFNLPSERLDQLVVAIENRVA